MKKILAILSMLVLAGCSTDAPEGSQTVTFTSSQCTRHDQPDTITDRFDYTVSFPGKSRNELISNVVVKQVVADSFDYKNYSAQDGLVTVSCNGYDNMTNELKGNYTYLVTLLP